jgi:hypothetical protein
MKQQVLPSVVEEKLISDLENFKKLLVDNEEFAKELITAIATAPSDGHRIIVNKLIRDEFKEITKEEEYSLNDLLSTSGSLLRLVTGSDSVYKEYNIEPIYHDTIQIMMLNL